jgi:hypothetical protein
MSQLAYGFSDATFDRTSTVYDSSITMSPMRFVCVLTLFVYQASKNQVTIALHKLSGNEHAEQVLHCMHHYINFAV